MTPSSKGEEEGLYSLGLLSLLVVLLPLALDHACHGVTLPELVSKSIICLLNYVFGGRAFVLLKKCLPKKSLSLLATFLRIIITR